METKHNPMFSVEFLFKDLSEAGFERIDAELKRIAGFSVVELEDEEDTPLMGLRFSLSEDGKVVHQYYPPEGSPSPYEGIVDLSGDEVYQIEPDLDTITVSMHWEDIHPSTKRDIHESIFAILGKRKYDFKDDEYLGQASLDISHYMD